MQKVYIAKTNEPYKGTCEALDALGFRVRGKNVYIKPNLTGCRPSCDGMGIDIGAVKAVLERLNNCSQITIGESCGNTDKSFDKFGYRELIKEFPNVKLEDIRVSNIVWKKIPRPYHTKEMPFNANVFNHDYVVNIAKMKTHSLAGVSLCLKNIFGFVPTRKQKLMYHPFIRKALLDMNQVVPSHFCVVEGVYGNEFDEIQSTPKYTGVVIAGENILAVDIVAAAVMGIDLNKSDTYQMAFKLWGKPKIKVLGNNIDEVKKEKYRQGCLFSTRIRYIKETTTSLLYRAFNRH